MSIASVLWILAMSGLVTGVAGAAAAALRRLHRPERWVWIVALGVAAALPFLPAPTPVAVQASDAPAATTRGIPIAQVMTLASSSLPEPARVSIPWIPLLWAAGSATTVLLMLGGAWSLARRRERWPRRRVDGDLLRISDRFGPAVVGWIDPEIVLPEWAVELDQRPRRLILRHENEHRWAKDPQLLALGVLLLAAAPWNPFAWLQFRGLRRAVEFDCDARVLGSGASPRAYGRLLLSVQLDGGRGVLFAPALREPASFLERRLQTMKLRDRPVARLRVAGLALIAVMLTVVACETPRPTESERADEAPALIQSGAAEQSAGAAESYRARIEQLADQYEQMGFDTRWRLDGEQISAPRDDFDYGQVERMMSVATNPPEGEPMIMVVELFTDEAPQVEVVEVPPELPSETDRCADGSEPRDISPTGDINSGLTVRGCLTEEPVAIREDRHPGGESREATNSIELWRFDGQDSPRLVTDDPPSTANSPIRPLGESWDVEPGEDGRTPLIYVDGVRIDPDAREGVLGRIRPADIERIEVIKGTAARTLYGEDARHGVIQIFTKAGG